ncbi:unnamed protein product, partial [marine sediment metagenome]
MTLSPSLKAKSISVFEGASDIMLCGSLLTV